jgi:hypothetical protein
MLKWIFSVSSVLMCTSLVFGEFSFNGDVGILGIKNIGDLKTANNLDVLWGRVNFITAYSDSNFSSAIQLRIYPAGYGFDYVSSATYDPSTNAIVTTRTNETKLQIIQGWAQYKFNSLKIKVGLIPLKYTTGSHFGDYAQRGAGGSYLYPGVLHNATLITHDVKKILNSQMLLGVNDKNLNRAYFMLKETVTPVDMFSLSATFRSNFFDRIADSEAKVVSALSFNLLFNYMKGQKVYAELGLRELGNDDVDVSVPFTFGVTVPTNGVLDICTAELEYSAERADADKPGLFWSLYVGKNIGKHFQVQTSLYNNSAAKKSGDLCWGLYFVSKF